ncbi:MAG: hypothetical protein HDR80_00035 [Bacteroides sp.]|nr:hypothetical protein [Bacteroides sp.]
MKKIFLPLLLLTGLVASEEIRAQSLLTKSFDSLKTIEWLEEIPDSEATSYLWANDCRITLHSAEILMAKGLNDKQLIEGSEMVISSLMEIPRRYNSIGSYNAMNALLVYSEPNSAADDMEILMYWQANLAGEISVWHGYMDKSDFMMFELGDVSISYSGLHFSPIRESMYDVIKMAEQYRYVKH